jgi:hypothetical protein
MSKSARSKLQDFFEGKKKILPPYSIEGYEQTGSYTDEDDADRQVLNQLIQLGSDLRKERHSIHYFYFETEAGADEARKELARMQFEARAGAQLESEPTSRRWPVIAERTEVIDEKVIRILRKPLTEIAKRHGGEYDGWEAAAD